ncbi:MAG: urea ABC transporter ATP-binding protein UrtD [Burkholderiaceae bacterium]|nr:urea ABC transporter ATP-binding protein UrtD [Burkholderiaceae bacterium]MEB2320474.1 urea ABC transporter ATP-binding protein UrtD [Pseudomonadota bacterium]
MQDEPVAAAAVDETPLAGAGGRDAAFGRVVSDTVDLSHGVALYVEDVMVSFDGFRALNRLSLTIGRDELRCVIGPNGAGKTTMMDVITGKTRPDEGRVFFGQSHDLLRMSEPRIADLGIGRKFQKPTVFEAMSVFDNIELALKAEKSARASVRWRLGHAQRERIEEVLAQVRLAGHAATIAGTLSHGQKQWLEIGMLLAQDPVLLLLDEPVAGMTDEETMRTAELLLELEGKHAIVVVEHDMEFIAQIARTVTVLHEGSVLAEGRLDDVRADDRVIEVYLGR